MIAAISFIVAIIGGLSDGFNLLDRFSRKVTPIPQVQQVSIPSDDIVLTTFPYFVGNTWEYSFGTMTNASPDHPETNETGKYIAKVVNTETIEGQARVFYIEVSPPASNYAGF